jgi:hypothetical protein
MSRQVATTSGFRRPGIIPDFTVDKKTLRSIKEKSPLHYAVACACIRDGRWHFVDAPAEAAVHG